VAAKTLLVLSNVIIDEIVLPEGGTRTVLGGAGAYAAVGAAGWWPSVSIVAGIGRDLEQFTAEELPFLRPRATGLLLRDEHTIRTRIEYLIDGERRETPLLGLEHFERLQISPEDVPDTLLPAAGTYCFRDLSRPFWQALGRRALQFGVILWELQGSAAAAQSWPALQRQLPLIDIFSLNLPEAHRLFGAREINQMVSELLIAGADVVLLRMGAQGAVLADRRTRLRLHPPPSPIIDVTGAGNSFCGAFLAAWCATHNLEQAGRAAAAAAAYCMAAFGPRRSLNSAALTELATATRIEHIGAVT
jgi:sugar/nucleoside kinase (ribokinase family)